MTYAPPPYAAPVHAGDPTNVMGRRVVAHLIDVIVIGIIFVAIFFATAQKITGVPTDFCTSSSYTAERVHNCVQIGGTAYRTDGGATSLSLLVVLGYWIVVGLIEGATGAFFGKRILGLRVVSGDGTRAGAGRGALRGFLMVVDSLLCFVIGLVTALATHPHRRVGDMAAGTYVVGKESLGHPVSGWNPNAYVSAPPPYGTAPNSAAGQWQPPESTGTAMPADAGWGAPSGSPPQQWRPPTPAQAAPPVVQDPTEPHWDAARNAWIAWEPTRGQWMQFDATSNEWRAM